jgi:hypothetical protein
VTFTQPYWSLSSACRPPRLQTFTRPNVKRVFTPVRTIRIYGKRTLDKARTNIRHWAEGRRYLTASRLLFFSAKRTQPPFLICPSIRKRGIKMTNNFHCCAHVPIRWHVPPIRLQLRMMWAVISVLAIIFRSILKPGKSVFTGGIPAGYCRLPSVFSHFCCQYLKAINARASERDATV